MGMTGHHSPQWWLTPPCCLQEGTLPAHLLPPGAVAQVPTLATFWLSSKESARRVVTSMESVGSSSSALLPIGASSPGKKWRHQSALLGRRWGHVAHLRAQDLRSLSWDRRHSLPSTTLVNLVEAAASALGPGPLEKPKWSDPHKTSWGGGQGCGEVCCKDSW